VRSLDDRFRLLFRAPQQIDRARAEHGNDNPNHDLLPVRLFFFGGLQLRQFG
jgi:hypothetical protein